MHKARPSGKAVWNLGTPATAVVQCQNFFFIREMSVCSLGLSTDSVRFTHIV